MIVSSAIPEENEELKEAKRLNLPIILRGDMLASLVNDKKVSLWLGLTVKPLLPP